MRIVVRPLTLDQNALLFLLAGSWEGGTAFRRGEGKALLRGVEFASQAKPETDRGAVAPANWYLPAFAGTFFSYWGGIGLSR